MLARTVFRTAQRVAVPMKVTNVAFRSMGHHAHDNHGKPAAAAGDVVIPELVDTLEWVLSSPPNVHQFEEPPIVVEIEHLKAVPVLDLH